MKKKRSLFSLGLALLMVASLFVTLPKALKAADDSEEHYDTWKKYTEAGGASATWNDVADAMDDVFDYAKELFAAGDMDGAYYWVSNAGYYGYYETTGFERKAMSYIAGSRKTEVELQFSACKAIAKKSGSAEDFNNEVETLKSMIRTDANILDGKSDSSSDSDSDSTSTTKSTSAAVATFTGCFSIILREGFEAILILGTIIAYLVKASKTEEERKKKCRPVYFGAIIGIALSFVLAWLLSVLKAANTAKQELIEGCTALLAVCVLYYVSNWMLSKSESDAWTKYIKDKTEKSMKKGKGGYFALAFTSFLAVFREGAEVVLFIQPELSDGNAGSVWAGIIVGFIVLIFVYMAIRFLTVKIPIKAFFTVMSVIMAIMSISFLGAGIKELMEGDVIKSFTSPSWLQWIPYNDTLDVFGIYPILETLIPQFILLVVTIVLFIIQGKKNRAIRLEAEAKRAEERAELEAKEKAEKEAELKELIRGVVKEVLAEQNGNS